MLYLFCVSPLCWLYIRFSDGFFLLVFILFSFFSIFSASLSFAAVAFLPSQLFFRIFRFPSQIFRSIFLLFFAYRGGYCLLRVCISLISCCPSFTLPLLFLAAVSPLPLLCPGSEGLLSSVPCASLVFMLLALALLFPSAEHWVPLFASSVLLPVEPASLLRWWFGSCSGASLGGVSLSCCDGPIVPCPPSAAPSLGSSWLCLFLQGSGVLFCISFRLSYVVLHSLASCASSVLFSCLVACSGLFQGYPLSFLFASLCTGFLL